MSNHSYKKGPFWFAWTRFNDDRVSIYIGLGMPGLSIRLSTNSGLQVAIGRQPIDVIWG